MRTRGSRGELAAIPLGNHPDRTGPVFVNQARLEIERVWMHGDRVIYKFRGIDSISQAEPLVGAELCIPAEERLALPAGEFYQSDLIGCEVVEQSSGRSIGVVAGWQEYGGPPLLETQDKNGREILIPFAASICVHIDAGARRIEVNLPEGLDEL